MSDTELSIIVGVPKETYPGEHRVALIPASVPALQKKGVQVVVETGAGEAAGFPDSDYETHGAEIASSRGEVFARAQAVLQVRALGANPDGMAADMELYRQDQIVVGFLDPLSEPNSLPDAATKGITAFSMELVPRITRAQSMDALSSQANIAGYKAVLMAANAVTKLFPMMMTAAGTIAPAHVFVIGAGVAGLQAIATAKRLGAKVKAFDVRAAVKEQIHSLGALFVEVEAPEEDVEDKGGYAKEQSEEYLKKQREVMGQVAAESDVIITTAAIPGKAAPVLITEDMVKNMKPGSVIVDLAAERGGNCALTQPGETINTGGVIIMGTLNIPALLPHHASQMYAKNISTFLLQLVKDGAITIDESDEVIAQSMVVRGGDVVHGRIRELLGMEPLPQPEPEPEPEPETESESTNKEDA